MFLRWSVTAVVFVLSDCQMARKVKIYLSGQSNSDREVVKELIQAEFNVRK